MLPQLRMKNYRSEKRPLGMVLLTLFSIVLISVPTSGAVATELLEKAIYTEETVGDLDKAIAIYEKVLAEGKKSAEAAAEAQYRIGICYEKQGKAEAASKAFQAVIDDFPTAKAWVAKAKSHQPGQIKLLPVPWGKGDEMIYEMKLPTGLGVGHQVFRVAEIERNGKKYWECSAWQTVILSGASGKSHVLIDHETFAPIESKWKNSVLGEAEAKYDTSKVVINMVHREEPLTFKHEGAIYDNEQVAELFRRLPLQEGYKTTIDVMPILTGTRLPLEVEVTKLETIKTTIGEFECFKLELNIGQTFWISNDENRYLVRFEAGVTADLVEVRPYKANQTTQVKQERFSVTLPPEWYAYTPDQPEDQSPETILIDPTASFHTEIEAGSLEKMKKKHDSAKAWAEHVLGQIKKRKKGYSLSGGGIQEIKVGDRDATLAELEFLEGDKRMKTRLFILFGDTSAASVRFSSSAEDFEKLQRASDKILASLEVK